MPDSTRRERLLGVLKKVTPQTLPADDEESLFESGLLDSFALPDLVSALEQEFAIKIPDRDLNPRKFDSIARIEAYLEEHSIGMSSFLHAFGCHVPERVVTNAEIAARVGRTAEWIESASGIRERRWADAETTVADLAMAAAGDCLARAGTAASALGLVVVASGSARAGFPGPAAEVAARLGLEGTPAMDVPMASAGSLFGLAMASQMAGRFGDVLVIGAEKMSAVIEAQPLDPNTAILFGDGAGAVLVSARPGPLGNSRCGAAQRRPVPRRPGVRLGRAAAHERLVGDPAGRAQAAFGDRGGAGAPAISRPEMSRRSCCIRRIRICWCASPRRWACRRSAYFRTSPVTATLRRRPC